jgi:hypothetical protein
VVCCHTYHDLDWPCVGPFSHQVVQAALAGGNLARRNRAQPPAQTPLAPHSEVMDYTFTVNHLAATRTQNSKTDPVLPVARPFSACEALACFLRSVAAWQSAPCQPSCHAVACEIHSCQAIAVVSHTACSTPARPHLPALPHRLHDVERQHARQQTKFAVVRTRVHHGVCLAAVDRRHMTQAHRRQHSHTAVPGVCPIAFWGWWWLKRMRHQPGKSPA